MVQLGTREQLTKRNAEQIEEQYRQELKANLNSKKCFITDDQKREIEKIRNQNYYEENKDKLKEYIQNYYEANKDKILEYHQNYYEVNKDRINEKVNCDCGCEVSRTNLLRHQKSKRHLNNMNNI